MFPRYNLHGFPVYPFNPLFLQLISILLDSPNPPPPQNQDKDSLPPRRPLRPPQHLDLLLHGFPPKRLHPAAAAAAPPIDPPLVVPVNDGVIGYGFVSGDGAEGVDFAVLYLIPINQVLRGGGERRGEGDLHCLRQRLYQCAHQHR